MKKIHVIAAAAAVCVLLSAGVYFLRPTPPQEPVGVFDIVPYEPSDEMFSYFVSSAFLDFDNEDTSYRDYPNNLGAILDWVKALSFVPAEQPLKPQWEVTLRLSLMVRDYNYNIGSPGQSVWLRFYDNCERLCLTWADPDGDGQIHEYFRLTEPADFEALKALFIEKKKYF